VRTGRWLTISWYTLYVTEVANDTVYADISMPCDAGPVGGAEDVT
jgi:hypothetical protein